MRFKHLGGVARNDNQPYKNKASSSKYPTNIGWNFLKNEGFRKNYGYWGISGTRGKQWSLIELTSAVIASVFNTPIYFT